METKKYPLSKLAIGVMLGTFLALSAMETASAGGWLEKQVKKTGESVKKAGQDVIDATREPVKKVLPRVVTKETDKAADFVIEKRKKAEAAVDKFIDDPVKYLTHLPGSILADVCSAPAQYYGKVMEEQARGKWKRLPPELIQAVQDNYKVNLGSVEYAEGVATSNGAAQTIGKRIYFPRSIDLTRYDDLHWMLHELEHTVQFGNATYGTAGKLCEYVAKAIGSGGRHDAIDMERAADAKADSLIEEAYVAMSGDDILTPASDGEFASNELEITNTLNVAVVFEMATDSLGNEPETLEPGESAVFTGNPGDSRFFLRIATRVGRGAVSRQYTLAGGTRAVIDTDGNGIFDFFHAK